MLKIALGMERDATINETYFDRFELLLEINICFKFMYFRLDV